MHLKRIRSMGGACQHRTPPGTEISTGAEAPRGEHHQRKKRPAPEGAGLPDVVSFDIVNWEGNYILDTNIFLIVINPSRTLALFTSVSPFLFA
jgi:hypothetical protein